MIAIAGAGVWLLPELASASATLPQTLAVGSAAALASGLAALWLFVWLLRAQRFYLFAGYAWAAGAATLVAWALSG